MKAAIRSSALARIFLVAGFGVALSAMPASAQKQGGSITVGLELDIPGFDPLKVGVYDTAALKPRRPRSSIRSPLSTTRASRSRSSRCPGPIRTTSRPGPSSCGPASSSTTARRSMPQAVKANFDRQKDPANKCRCAFYIAYVNDVQAPDELTVVYNLNDPSVNLPALMTYPESNNVVHSPTAWKTKGDDYNRNPVGTGPYILKSWTAGDRMVLEKNPDYWNKGHPYLDRIVLKPLPDAQSRFASLQSGEADIIWDDEYDADNIQKAQKDPKLKVHTYAGSGAAGLRLQHQGRAVRRCARAPGAGDGDRPQEDVAGDHQWPGPAGHQSLWRRLLGQVQGRRRAARGRREGQGADQGLRQAGRFQDARHRDAARTHHRPGAAAVLEAGRRQHGDRAGRSGHHPAARLHAPVPGDALADRRPRRSRSADVCQLPHRQPGGARQLLQSGARQAARARAHHGRYRQAHRGLLRDQPADQQGGDLVLDLPEHLLRDLEREGEGPAEDVSAG